MHEIDPATAALAAAVFDDPDSALPAGLLDRLTSSYVVSWIGLMRYFHGGDLGALMVLAFMLNSPTPLGGFTAASVATPLGLPRGMILRKANRLVEAGFLQWREEGFGLAQSQLRTEAALAVRRTVAARTRLFVEDLRRYDRSGTLPGRLELDMAEDSAVFLASAQLCLRLLREMVRWTDGDVMLGIVFLAVREASTPDLSADRVALLASRLDLSDDLRRPVSIDDLVRGLGAAPEVIRRYVIRLIEGGACRPMPGGVFASEAIFETGPAQAANERNRHHVRRFLSVIATHARIIPSR